MPDEAGNTLAATDKVRSKAKGDVPEALRRRYFLDERGGPGVGFYVDARVQAPAFRDQGARLTASRPDPNAVRDMVAIAQHRGWTVVVVQGEADFRREAWLVAMASGIDVRGYRPTDRDRQELERRRAALARTAARTEAQAQPDRQPRGDAAAAHANMRVVEAVVRSRIVEPSAQERILGAARERFARWLEQGAHVKAVPVAQAARSELDLRRERQRSR